MEKENLTDKEKCENEIRIYKKNENAICDICALYDYLIIDDHRSDTLVGEILIDEVINDLVDEEVSYYKSNVSLDTEFYEILNKYRDIDECKELIDNFNISQKRRILNGYCALSNNNYYIFNKEISDLLAFLFVNGRNSSLIKRILYSNTSFDRKLETFTIYVKQCLYSSPNGLTDLSTLIDEIKDDENLKELILNFEDTNKIANYMVNANDPILFSFIPKLQQICNFNDERLTDDLRETSFVYIVICMGGKVEDIEELYESDSYMNFQDDIRENNDKFILCRLHTIDDITKFISLTHFSVTKEIIEIIISKIDSEFSEIEGDIDFTREEFPFDDEEFLSSNAKSTISEHLNYINSFISKVSDAILRKATNKSEYKKYCKYIKDIEEYAKLEEDKIRFKYDPDYYEENKEKIDDYREKLVSALEKTKDKVEDNISNLTKEEEMKNTLRKKLTIKDLIVKNN